jgi:hypothetical protein
MNSFLVAISRLLYTRDQIPNLAVVYRWQGCATTRSWCARKTGYICYTKLWQRFAPTHQFQVKKTMLLNYMMSELSTIFAEPGEGIHKHYCGVAVADVAMTGMAALVISKLTNNSFPLIFAALIALGISVHATFGIPTALNKKIGLVPDVNSQIRD